MSSGWGAASGTIRPPGRVSRGAASRAHVVAHCLRQFRRKYDYLLAHIGRMDALLAEALGAHGLGKAPHPAGADGGGAGEGGGEGGGGGGGGRSGGGKGGDEGLSSGQKTKT